MPTSEKKGVPREIGVAWREHLRRTARRCITVPVLSLATLLLLASLPIVVPLLAILDLARPMRPWARCRALLSITWIASCELVGVAASFALWLAYLVHRKPQRFLASNARLQAVWTQALFAGARRIFKMRIESTGLEQAAQGPILLLVRHASLVDTVLTAAVLANPAKLRLRYVLKDELLNDPCIDIVGNRLQNAFVSRSSKLASDLKKVRDLSLDLRDNEGVLIYPEGTRFTKSKLARAQERLASDPIAGPYAKNLKHVLPPRPGGTLALLGAAPHLDVVILAHRGLEGAATLGDFWRGELVETTLRVCAWRIAAADVPADASENPQWLMQQWKNIDDWIEALD